MKDKLTQIKNNIEAQWNKMNEKWNDFINKKYIKSIFAFLPHNIIVFLFFIISIFTFIQFVRNDIGVILYSQTITDSNVGPIITEPYEISLKNIEISENPNNICFTFATYGRKTNSKYKFELYHGEEKVYEKSFNSKVLSDGQNYCFATSSITKDDIHEYSAKIVPIYTNIDNVITIFKNTETDVPAFYITKNVALFSIRNLIMAIYIILFLGISFIINKKEIKPEKFWIYIALIYLLEIMFIYPPFQVPDEPVHFYNAYRLSQLDKNKSLYENLQNGEIIVPKSIECLNYSRIQDVDKVTNFNEVIECAKNTENAPDYNYGRYNYVNTKLGYLTSSVGIKIADIATNSPLLIFYSGRLVNFMISVTLIFIAIKVIPKYKELILLVATIPMFIQQQGSYSYDVFINALSILAIAVIIKMIYQEKIKWLASSIVLLICGTFIVNIKMIYLPIMLFLLFLPDEKFKKRFYKYLYCIGVILLMVLLGKLTQILFNNGVSPTIIGDSENMQRIIKNPLLIISIAGNTIKENGMFYLRSLIGYFGWFTFRLSDCFIYAYIICFGYIVAHNNFIKSEKINKYINIVGILFSIAAIFASMYFTWSKPGLEYVDGVQGRYFIPLLLPLVLLCMSKNKKKNLNKKNIYYFINIILLQYLLTLLVFFY